jgi:hypothetical protein
MKILAALLFAASAAHAQAPAPCPCTPWESSPQWFALVVDHNLFGGPGPWLRWSCYSQSKEIPAGSTQAPGPVRRCAIAQPWGSVDLRKLGDRVETIRLSPDSRAAFVSSWRRHVTLPLSDPSLASMRAAMHAAIPPTTPASAIEVR